MKARPGEILAGVCGALLLVALFFDWYDAGDVVTVTAWQAFTFTDIVLAAAGIGGLAVLYTQATSRNPAVPVAVTVAVTALSVLAWLMVVYRLLNQPGPNDVVGLEPGAYLGLLLTAGLFYGCGKAMRDESARAATRPIPVQEMPVPPASGGAPS